MKRWEYLVVERVSEFTMSSDYLNGYGKEGWELINVLKDIDKHSEEYGDEFYTCVFKRPVE